MIVLICGDRNWETEDSILRELSKFSPTETIIIHGAARGADSIADKIATNLGFSIIPFPADWDTYGKMAGMLRNRLMLKMNPGLVLAFHSDIDNSKGTKNMIDIAKTAHIEVRLFTG